MGEPEPLNETLRIGLLLEAAQNQQQRVEEALAGLREHAQALDERMSAQVGRALEEVLADLHRQVEEAARALRRLHRAADVRWMLCSTAATLLSALLALSAAHLMLPSSEQVAALRARRAQFLADIARLRRYGGAVEMRRCGVRGRLCVRVQRGGPAYGAHGDFLPVKAP